MEPNQRTQLQLTSVAGFECGRWRRSIASFVRVAPWPGHSLPFLSPAHAARPSSSSPTPHPRRVGLIRFRFSLLVSHRRFPHRPSSPDSHSNPLPEEASTCARALTPLHHHPRLINSPFSLPSFKTSSASAPSCPPLPTPTALLATV
jgi:hypothetical protein